MTTLGSPDRRRLRARGAAPTCELDLDELNTEQGLRITTPCPRCGAQAIVVAPGRYQRDDRGHLIRTGDCATPGQGA